MAQMYDGQRCSLYDGDLLFYPSISSSSTVEVVGKLLPLEFSNSDLMKNLVSSVSDATTQAQGPSSRQIKLIRARVAMRLLEDAGRFDEASYMNKRVYQIEREMQMEHEDPNFTDSTGEINA